MHRFHHLMLQNHAADWTVHGRFSSFVDAYSKFHHGHCRRLPQMKIHTNDHLSMIVN
jgi:hypothetical protein